MLKARFVLSACFVLALLGAGWCAVTFAGKPAPPPPAPPPPPPPGKILYASQGLWQMNGDGSGKAALFELPNDVYTPVPSLGSYGADHHRWWLVVREPTGLDIDLYATDGDSWIQLTASGFADNGDGTEAHWRFAPNGATPSWSNDGLDSFCSISMVRWVHHQATGVNSDIERFIVRLDVSAADLETMVVDPLLEDEDPEITHVIITTTSSYNAFREHHWSPDGTKITFLNYFNNAELGPDLWVADVSDLSGGPVDASDALKLFENGNTFGVAGPRWSPPGITPQRISFECGTIVYTRLPDGSQPAVQLTAGWGAFWSPDGKYIAYRVPVYLKGRTRQYDIARIPSGGGAIVTLFAGSFDKIVYGWSE